MIECTTLFGDKKLVEPESLTFRLAAYGIIVHEDKILLVNTKSTGNWFFPGGAIELGERVEAALKREIKEETGIEITIKKFFKFHENFFYYDPWDKAFHNLSFIYLCTPKTFELSDAKNEKRDEAEKPQWIPIENLNPQDFQDFAAEIFQEYLQK